jgi:hypothetical protein
MLLNIRPVPAPTLTNLVATPAVRAIVLKWDMPTDPTYAGAEVWSGSTNVVGSATKIGSVKSNNFTDAGSNVNPTLDRYYWVRAINTYGRADGAWSNNVVAKSQLAVDLDIAAGAVKASNLAVAAIDSITGNLVANAVGATQLANGAVSATKFASGIEPVSIVSTLPTVAGYTGPKVVMLSSDGKLYRLVGTAWTTSVATSDLSGTVSGTQIAANAIDATKFATSIAPIGIVTALPTVAGYTGPKVVMLSTDGKLYRLVGTSWTAAVSATDLTGTLTDAQVDSLAASKITGQLSNTQLAAIDASKVSGQLTGAQIADLEAAKISGSLTNAQIAALDASKLTGTLSAARIATGALDATKFASAIAPIGMVATLPTVAGYTGPKVVMLSTDGKLYRLTGSPLAWTAAVPSTDLSGTIVGTQITDGAISTAKIAANAITAAKIAANTITANEIAADTITAGQIAAGAVTATELAAGAVTAAKIAIGDFQNLVKNPSGMFDKDGWAGAPFGTASNITDGSSPCIEVVNGSRDMYIDGWFPVSPGDEFWVSFEGKWMSGDTGAANLGLSFSATHPGLTGQLWYSGATVAGGTSTWLSHAGKVTAPAGAAFAAVWLQHPVDSGVLSTWRFRNVRVVRRNKGELIVDGAVTANTIAAGAITTTKIATGAVTANEIAANAITASKLSVGSAGSALNLDPGFEDATAWTLTNAGSIVTLTDGKVGNKAARSITNGTSEVYGSKRIPADIAKVYRVRAWVRKTVTANGSLYIGVQCLDASGANVTGNGTYWYTGAVGPANAAIGTGWTEFSGTFNGPGDTTFTASCKTMAPIALLNYAGTAGYMEIQDLRIEEVLPATLIQNGAITTAKIAANAVTAAQIAANTITATQIKAGTITATEIAADTITAANIAALAITSSELAAGAVTAAKIAAGTITANEIAADTITGAKIAANTITASEIAANTITAAQIAAGTISATEIAAGAITTSKLSVIPESMCPDPYFTDVVFWGLETGWYTEAAAGGNVPDAMGVPRCATLSGATAGAIRRHIWSSAIQYSGMGQTLRLRARLYNSSNQAMNLTVRFLNAANTAVGDLNLQAAAGAGAVTLSNQMAVPATAVRYQYIVYNASGSTMTGFMGVSAVKLDIAGSADLLVDGAITAAKIAANTITAGQIKGGTITATEIAANTITAGQIKAGAISATEIASDAVTAVKILAGAITAGKIAAGAIVATDIKAGTITANELASDSITAAKIKAGEIQGTHIAANAITAGKIAAGAITASNIVISGFGDNLVPDPYMKDPVWWGRPNAEYVTVEGTDTPWRSHRFMRLNQGNAGGRGVWQDTYSPMFPIERGAWYKVQFQVYMSGDFNGYLTVAWHLPNKAWHFMGGPNRGYDWNAQEGSIPMMFDGGSPKGFYQYEETVYMEDDNVYLTRSQFRIISKMYDGYIELGGFRVTRVNDGSLIVNGAITAQKMSVQSLSAVSANIGLLSNRVNGSGQGIQMEGHVIRVFDANNVVRVKLGHLG